MNYYCTNCGNKIPNNNSTTCVKCGNIINNEKKSEKQKKLVIKKKKLILIIVLLLPIFIYMSSYHSIDFKNDEEIKEYLINYINNKYGVNSQLILDKKELEPYCTFWLDGCWHYKKNKNVYNYEYTGVDQYNNVFKIEYTTSHIVNFKVHISDITENYYIYYDERKIKNIVNNYYSNFKTYINTDEKDIIIYIYDNNTDTNTLSHINDQINKLNNNFHFKIIFTNDIETYKAILASNDTVTKNAWSWNNQNIITDSLNYKEIISKKTTRNYHQSL